ncbi:MAG: hypothetical protein KC731_17835, partial [Myxococcales bacterium]|nr:hypothetical protein [Myxococcales bacterium]
MALRSKLLLLAVGASSVVFTHGLASVAHAGPAPAVASASSRQHALAVALDGERREVTAQACREAERCVATGGRSYAIPAGADLANATLEVVSLAPDSRVVLVDVPLSGAEPAGSASKGRWVLLLAASAAKGAPHVEKLLVGTLDRPEGLEGEERSKVLLREREGGHERLLLGRRYAHAGLCGRPTTMRVSKLDPADRTWSEAPTVALSAAEREAAVPLIAERAEGGWPEGPSLLHARLASSALGGQRSALTDGDLATSWVETRPGVGEGEFVVMSGEASVPVSGFDLVLRAKGDAPPDRAAPRRVFVATRDQVFSIALGEDAGQEAPGQRYSVGLPKPVRSDCYALVLDEAFGDASHQAVAIAELRAQTPFDGMTLEALAAALDDEAKAEGAAALLNAGDAEAVTAVMNAYPQLSFDARRRALDLVGSGPCTATAPFYVERVLGRGAGDDFDPALDPIARAARDRLRRCRQPATAALGAAISEAGVTKERVWAARELAEIEPAQAVPAILAVLAEGSTAPSESGAKDEVRRGLRVALATAARDRHGAPAVQAALAAPAFAALSPVERVDLLR